MTCAQLMRIVHEWLEKQEIDTGWIFFEALFEGQYEGLEDDSQM
jgi:hypothetical protein